MKKPTRQQLMMRRRVIASLTLALVFGMGAYTQRKVYKKSYQPPVIALAQNKQAEDYSIEEVEEIYVRKSIDGTAYVNERAYEMYKEFEMRTLEVNGQELYIALDKHIQPGVKVQETYISGNRIRVIIED